MYLYDISVDCSVYDLGGSFDQFIDDLYEKMTTLSRLKQAETGPLPPTAIGLLGGLAAVWCGIIAYVVADCVKKQKRAKNTAGH